MITCCRADLSLDLGCAGHLGIPLYFCDDCAAHACVHMAPAVAAGQPPTAFPARGSPPVRITAMARWSRATCLVLWRGHVWGGVAPTFVVETQARLSCASTVTRLVEWGLN